MLMAPTEITGSPSHNPIDRMTESEIAAWRAKREQRKAKYHPVSSENKDDLKELERLAEEENEYPEETIMTAAKRRKLEQEEIRLARQKQTRKDNNPGNHEDIIKLYSEEENQQAPAPQDRDTAPSHEETGPPPPDRNISLLEQAAQMQHRTTKEEREEQQRKQEEERILREASKVQTNALQAAQELAEGTLYKDPMPSSWKPPTYILKQGPQEWQKIRDKYHMQIEGDHVPPPMERFIDFRFPAPVQRILERRGIDKPTPIQMQGLSVALAGRDMVGIAFTGSGKTLSFTLPLVMAALEEELRLPLQAGEGPIGIILAPSRELARQTYDQVEELCREISHTPGYPELRCQLLIGGESVREQTKTLERKGLHCVVATPGRLRDVLKRKVMNLQICRFICLDEADRMLDLGFDEEVGQIMNFFPAQRQTLLFSATFPRKFQDFARGTLVKPVVVNVGRAGAANLDVIQEVEYVQPEARIVYLLHCLQKTAPPVIIFAERKGDVDDIHEYLLLKGVGAVSIHGGKDQEDRNQAIQSFRAGEKDVLVCSDIAAKGLDFPNIQHVINFDMPKEIENYVHRIGRTGRSGKTGVATTYINQTCEQTALLDLKGLLKEARQRIPPVLMMLEDPREKNGGAGCSFCGGLGHSIVDCPKIDKDARRVAGGQRDVLAGGGDW